MNSLSSGATFETIAATNIRGMADAGVQGESETQIGVVGFGNAEGYGVLGFSTGNAGVVGRSDGTTLGGHLLEGVVWPTLEVIVSDSPRHLRKTHDPDTGLALINARA